MSFSSESVPLADGSKASSTLSSAASKARGSACFICSSRSILTAASARSRIIDSTSRPTYPTSVNLVASTLMKGAPASLASRRAISVLPTPVGPIIRMFFGDISVRSSSVQLHSSPAVSERNGDGTFCIILSDDVFVEIVNDLPGGHVGHVFPLKGDLFDRLFLVCIDANITGDGEALLHYLPGAEFCIAQ